MMMNMTIRLCIFNVQRRISIQKTVIWRLVGTRPPARVCVNIDSLCVCDTTAQLETAVQLLDSGRGGTKRAQMMTEALFLRARILSKQSKRQDEKGVCVSSTPPHPPFERMYVHLL